MRAGRKWSVQIVVGEHDGQAYAEAALCDDIGKCIRGTGHARLALDALNAPKIRDEIAVARALNDLGRRLIAMAKEDPPANQQRPTGSRP